MAFRAPRYSWVHAARDVGASAITVSDTADTDFPVDNLIDDRSSTLFKWSASVTDPTIDVDLGSDFVTGLDRLIIPANHNIETLTIFEDDNAGFTSATTLLATTTLPTPGVLIDLAFAASSERHIRIEITGSDTYFLSQLYLTTLVTFVVGPHLKNALDSHKANVTRLLQPTGISLTVQNGPDQRVLTYPYEFALTGSDLENMEAMIQGVGMVRPFYVDPASFSATPGTDDPPIWMKFDEMPVSNFAVDVPMSGVNAKTYVLNLIESLD